MILIITMRFKLEELYKTYFNKVRCQIMNSVIIKKYIIYSLGMKAIQSIISKDKRASKVSATIPSFRGVLELKHNIPGRMRLHIPRLSDQSSSEALLQLEKVDGIESLDINTHIGTVIIRYKEEKISPALIAGIIIRILGLEEEINNKPKSKALEEMKSLNESLNMSIYEKTNGLVDFNSLLVISLLVVGARKTITSYRRPSGVDYLWWSYLLLRNL
jgi:hypothetical protein